MADRPFGWSPNPALHEKLLAFLLGGPATDLRVCGRRGNSRAMLGGCAQHDEEAVNGPRVPAGASLRYLPPYSLDQGLDYAAPHHGPAGENRPVTPCIGQSNDAFKKTFRMAAIFPVGIRPITSTYL